MRNVSHLPFIFIILFILSAFTPVFCQENQQIKKYNFTLGGGFGVLYGQAFEFVYPASGETKGELLSELIWDMKPVFYFGLNADFGLTDILSGPGFFSSLSVKAGIPANSGVMEDRDWQSTENSALTNFSSHDNKTDELFWIDFTMGASLPVKYLYIKPFINGSWMHFLFTGSDGYGLYARKKDSGLFYPIDDNPNKHNFSGRVISYKQDWLLLAAGFTVGTNILAPFHFDVSFQTSPLTYCAAEDNHFLTYTVFKDFTSFGLFLEPKTSVSFDVKKFSFSFDVFYRYISKTKGESYSSGINKSNFRISPNEAGAGLSVFDCQILIKYKF